MTDTCPICGLGPVDRPDDQGRHPACSAHARRPVARPCRRFGSWTSAPPDAPDDERVCSWCRRADDLDRAERERRALPEPPKPAGPGHVQRPAQTASQAIAEWVRA